MDRKPRLLEQVRERIRYRHYSIRTEKAYVGWIRRFILFHGKRHPMDMGASDVEAFLSFLANRGNVAASTQNQALSAILFLYREVLGIDLPWLDGMERVKKPKPSAGGLHGGRGEDRFSGPGGPATGSWRRCSTALGCG